MNGDPLSDRCSSRNDHNRMNQELNQDRNNVARFNQNQNDHQQFRDNNSYRGRDWGGYNFSRDYEGENGSRNQANHPGNHLNQNLGQFSENKENMNIWLNSSPLKPTSSESNESLERKSNSLESFRTTPIKTGRYSTHGFNNQGISNEGFNNTGFNNQRFNDQMTDGLYSQHFQTNSIDFGNAKPAAASFTNNRFDYRRGSIDSQATVIPTQEILERQNKTTDENNNRNGW
jgi:hypothetical protein